MTNRFLRRAAQYTHSKLQFRAFERQILKDTWEHHDALLDWALYRSARDAEELVYDSALVKRAHKLRQIVLSEFKNKFKGVKRIRILIHVPPKDISPGGYSLFSNLVDSISFLGIPCETLRWEESLSEKLSSFQPTVFLSSDNHIYLNRIDWNAIERYRSTYPLRIGLTASIQAYGNTPLSQRLNWARNHRIDFFYSFRSVDYLRSRKDYQPFFSEGYQVYSIEFGANPLYYYPVSGIERDLPYVFLASSNSDKQRRYRSWLTPILSQYPGFLDGPGWPRIKRYAPKGAHRYIYARAKVGINLHIEDSIEWASELNERTYILAACGVPQLIDNPKLLSQRFSSGAVFVASSPKEYEELFQYLIRNGDVAAERAELALHEVYQRHTTFHRAQQFIESLNAS